MGEYDSDVDIEGFEEDDDGKPKTPAPVIVLCNKKSPLPPPIIIAYKIKICIKQ